MVAPVENAQFMCLADLVAKAHAPGAKNAAFRIQYDIRPDWHGFMLFDFILEHFAVVKAMLHVEILEPALSGLVTNGTVQRMINEQELQNGSTRFNRLFTLGVHHHSVCDRRITRHLQLGHALDFDQTDAANPHDAESGMITIAGYFDSQPLSRLDDRGSLFYFNFSPIYNDFWHVSP